MEWSGPGTKAKTTVVVAVAIESKTRTDECLKINFHFSAFNCHPSRDCPGSPSWAPGRSRTSICEPCVKRAIESGGRWPGRVCYRTEHQKHPTHRAQERFGNIKTHRDRPPKRIASRHSLILSLTSCVLVGRLCYIYTELRKFVFAMIKCVIKIKY